MASQGGIVNGTPEYRSIMAVDIEKSSGRGNPALLAIREALSRCLTESFERSGILWGDCLVEDLGDGLRVTAPNGTRRTSLIHPLIYELIVRLNEHNRMHAALGRIRVRAALHSGDVFVNSQGIPAGGAMVVLARMLDSRACRDALANAPEPTPLVLMVSQHFYEEAVQHGYLGIDPSAFKRIDVSEKEYSASAWLYIPGNEAPQPEPPATKPGISAGAPGDATRGDHSVMTVTASDQARAYGVKNGDMHIHDA